METLGITRHLLLIRVLSRDSLTLSHYGLLDPKDPY